MLEPRGSVLIGGTRWSPVVTVLPYVLLGALAGFTVVIKHTDTGSLLIDLALCGFAAIWMLCLFTLRPTARERTAPMVLFLTVLLMVMTVLVLRDPWFGVFAPAAYFYAFSVLPWPWRLAGVAAVAMLAGTAQASNVDKGTTLGVLSYLGVLAANVVPMCAFTWLVWRGGQQNRQREQALAEAREANRKLEASLAENEGLQRQLMEQAREAGAQDERQRMAREIHDTLAQGLTGIITQLQAAEQTDAKTRERHLSSATELARESLAEARRSVHALRPEPLETARLSEVLAQVADRWSTRHQIEARVTTTGTVRTTAAETESALLRTAQEALANVARHALASRVGVTLSYMEAEIVLDIRDDGTGFDPARAEGFGLLAMRQRIGGLDGKLLIESEPGLGTAISATIPAVRERV